MGHLPKASSNRSPIEVPVKTVFVFGSLFTGFRNDGHLNELLVEIGTDVVEKEREDVSTFLLINKSDIRKISLVLTETGRANCLDCLVFLKGSDENLWMLLRFGST